MDIFTLQLSFTATSPDSFLGRLSGHQWFNAIDGNTGNNARSPKRATSARSRGCPRLV